LHRFINIVAKNKNKNKKKIMDEAKGRLKEYKNIGKDPEVIKEILIIVFIKKKYLFQIT
jgi:uncharacterized protein (DUF1786 family)